MENNKKTIILGVIAITTFAMLLIGATYAYFSATGGDAANSNLNVITASTDLTTFKIDKAINIAVTQSDFAKGSGNKSDSTKAIATFTASNSVNVDKSSDRYNIYFIIENNDFIYTTNDTTPEILLNVTDPNGNKIENITGLIHTENGFDITTRTGGFLIMADYDIEASRAQTVSQEWNVEVTFVNLDTDQVKNMGKTLTGKLYLTREKMSSYELTQISSVEPTTTYNSITANLNVSAGSAEIEKYYFGIEKVSSSTTGYIQKQIPYIKPLAISDVKFIETDKPYYEFKNLDDNATYKVYSYGIDKNKIKTNIYETEITTNAYNNPKVNSITHTSTLNSITISVSASEGDNEIVKYFFSKDNGATYEESTSNSFVFSGLTDTTEYKIKVKVQDSYGRYSTEYYEAISTETYILPSVTSVSPSTKYNQISVSVVGAKGTNNVAKYYYSIDGGTYVESSNATYTFTGLNEKTTHTIKVKVADTQGRMSNEYSLSATTDEYKVPTITNVTTSSTSSSITINITGQNGDGTINKYYYSKDNGSNYVESTSNSYTFSDLTSNTTFYIKVYVKDNNGRVSSVSTTSIATKTTIVDLCNSGEMLNDCIKKYGDTGYDNSNIFIHDEALTNGAKDNSYRYSGGDFYLTEKAKKQGFTVFTTNENNYKTTSTNLIDIICDDGTRAFLGNDPCRTVNPSTSVATYGAYLTYDSSHTKYKFVDAVKKAISDGYLLDNKIHNFVCFDNSDTCDPDNLYRIIGVIDNKIELIKNDFVSQSQLNKSRNNTAFSYLYMGHLPIVDTYYDNNNEILDALNNNYLKTFNNILMLDRKWKYGSDSANFDIEVFDLLDDMSYKYVHLNYILNKVSDELINDNWLFIGADWMLSSSTACESGTICLATAAIRPIFFLNEKVAYKSGDGSKTSPIRINTDKLSYFTLLGNKYIFEKEMTWADYFSSDFLPLQSGLGKMYVDGNKIWDGMNILLYDDHSTQVLLTDKIIPEEEYVAED